MNRNALFLACFFGRVRRRRKEHLPRQGSSCTTFCSCVRARVYVLVRIQRCSRRNHENCRMEITVHFRLSRSCRLHAENPRVFVFRFTNVLVFPDTLCTPAKPRQARARLTKGSAPQTLPSPSPAPLRTARSVHSRLPSRSAALCLLPLTPGPQKPGNQSCASGCIGPATLHRCVYLTLHSRLDSLIFRSASLS